MGVKGRGAEELMQRNGTAGKETCAGRKLGSTTSSVGSGLPETKQGLKMAWKMFIRPVGNS